MILKQGLIYYYISVKELEEMTTDTSERFEECLRDFKRKIDTSSVKNSDADNMYALAENLLLRYEEIRKSRESWKQKYYESTAKKKDPRTMTNCDPNFKKVS